MAALAAVWTTPEHFVEHLRRAGLAEQLRIGSSYARSGWPHTRPGDPLRLAAQRVLVNQTVRVDVGLIPEYVVRYFIAGPTGNSGPDARPATVRFDDTLVHLSARTPSGLQYEYSLNYWKFLRGLADHKVVLDDGRRWPL